MALISCHVLNGRRNDGVPFFALPSAGGGCDYLLFLLSSFNFHYTGDILSVLAACLLSSFVFFSQNCIVLVISNFVRCFYALVGHWFHLLLTHFVSPWSTSVGVLHGPYSVETFIEADSQNILHFQAGSQDYVTMWNNSFFSSSKYILVPAINFPMRCYCSSIHFLFPPQIRAKSIHNETRWKRELSWNGERSNCIILWFDIRD